MLFFGTFLRNARYTMDFNEKNMGILRCTSNSALFCAGRRDGSMGLLPPSSLTLCPPSKVWLAETTHKWREKTNEH